jgi:GNAT superfamily N-acetyltransferase
MIKGMKIEAFKTDLKTIQSFRTLFLQETNFQFIRNSYHERGWSDPYLLALDDVKIGYGAIIGKKREDRDTVFEFYVIPPFRKMSGLVFSALVTTSGANSIECQSNDLLLSSILYEFSKNIEADLILFEDDVMTRFSIPSVIFRRRQEDDHVFEHKVEPPGEYILEINGEIVATGGFMLHYNMPFADLYMEVKEEWQGKGLGSFLLQETKKECYLAGRVPAARCDIRNRASKATLIKAGLKVCGFMLTGDINNHVSDHK